MDDQIILQTECLVFNFGISPFGKCNACGAVVGGIIWLDSWRARLSLTDEDCRSFTGQEKNGSGAGEAYQSNEPLPAYRPNFKARRILLSDVHTTTANLDSCNYPEKNRRNQLFLLLTAVSGSFTDCSSSQFQCTSSLSCRSHCLYVRPPPTFQGKGARQPENFASDDYNSSYPPFHTCKLRFQKVSSTLEIPQNRCHHKQHYIFLVKKYTSE